MVGKQETALAFRPAEISCSGLGPEYLKDQFFQTDLPGPCDLWERSFPRCRHPHKHAGRGQGTGPSRWWLPDNFGTPKEARLASSLSFHQQAKTVLS